MGDLKRKFFMNSDLDEPTVRLPSAYQEVEYIESSGTQYIDTGVNAKQSIGFETNVRLTTTGSELGLFATTVGNRHYVLQNHKTGLTLYLYVEAGETQKVCQYQNDITDFHTISYNKYGNFTGFLDGVNAVQTLAPNNKLYGGDINYPFYLFARDYSGYAGGKGSFQLKYFKVYNNTILIRHFIPCYRKFDNEAGLYDLVNGVFYTNQGTGAFSIGDPVYYLPSVYQEVEYIESTGSQWIDTNVDLTINTGFYLDIINTNDFGSSNIGNFLGVGIYNSSTSTYHCRMWLSTYLNPNGNIRVGNNEYDAGLNKGSRIQVSLINNIYTKPDGTTIQIPNQIITQTAKLYLFNQQTIVNGQSVASNPVKMKLYSCKFYEGYTIIRYFKPCYRKSDNEIGLYDCVNNVFYTNSGTGTFAKGENVYYTLPKEYQKVEWIESVGGQYIDTNITPSSYSSLKIDFDTTYSNGSMAGMIIGTRDNSSNRLSALWSAYNTRTGIYIGSNLDFYTIWTIGSRYKCSLSMSNGKYDFVRNGTTEVNQVSFNGSLPSSHIGLFAQLVNSSSYDSSSANILYSFKVWGNNTLVRNLIPCYRKADNEIGLYDIVNNTFYANSGTGSFTKGANDYDIIG